jgi:hypothetical protein
MSPDGLRLVSVTSSLRVVLVLVVLTLGDGDLVGGRKLGRWDSMRIVRTIGIIA